ncbi:MAG: OB-fold domain-containing protein [Actinomycetota bacterium]|nr:OB-fold domain-containing protein [Actinomycetota bacterium]
MAATIPLVDYLVLDDGDAHLVANECTSCGARFFDRRNACAACAGTEFRQVGIAGEGTLRTFTIVTFAAPGIPVPFVAGVVDCAGTSVRANVVNVDPDPEHVHVGMPVRLTTFPIGTDSGGTEAIGFGFEPAGDASMTTTPQEDSE